MPHLLLFAATTGYQIRVFADAARRLGADLTLATDRCHVLDDPWGDSRGCRSSSTASPSRWTRCAAMPFDGIAAVGDRPGGAGRGSGADARRPVPSAGRGARLPRQVPGAATLPAPPDCPCPAFFRAGFTDDPTDSRSALPIPCVLKPLGLSASRGVIRAEQSADFAPPSAGSARWARRDLQVESYIPGREFAVEGLVTDGEFQPLAIFDKPDPLEGPFFEETIYVTPSREPRQVQRALIETPRAPSRRSGCATARCTPKCAITTEGAWMLEADARPIGGLCAQSAAVRRRHAARRVDRAARAGRRRLRACRREPRPPE